MGKEQKAPESMQEFTPLGRASQLKRLWLDRSAFARVLERAVDLALLRQGADADVRAFLDNVVARLLVRPDDLLSVCSLIEADGVAREFMRFVVRHPLLDRDLLHALVSSPDVFHALPDDPEWKEVAVLVYGSDFLNDHRGLKLAISDFAPLGVEVERSVVRSLVGSAFDEGILCDEDVARLLEVFPNDAYFSAKLNAPD